MRLLKVCFVAFVLISVSTIICEAVPVVTSIGVEETAGTYEGDRPSIAADSQNQPHIVVDQVNSGQWHLYDKINGTWQGFVFNLSSYYSPAGSIANPHIEIDQTTDRAWVSGIMYIGGNADGCGMGIVTRLNMSTDPSGIYFTRRYVVPSTAWPLGNLSIDPGLTDHVVVYASSGYWEELVGDGGTITSVGSGQMYSGNGGERTTFWISKAGNVAHADGTSHAVWHGAIGGHQVYDDGFYQNSVRHAQGLGSVVWCNPHAYPEEQGNEKNYVGLCSDNVSPEIAYIAGHGDATYNIIVNIWNGTEMVFSTSSLLSVDYSGSSGLTRFSPQWAAANKGGAWLCWTRASRIKVRYIAADGSTGDEVDVCAGTRGAICVDKLGSIHVVYSNGGTKYRELSVSGDTGSGSGVSTIPCDFDGDGKDDLTVYDSSTYLWYITNSTGSASSIAQWGFSGAVPVPGDYDGNGKGDLAMFYTPTYSWYILSVEGELICQAQWGFSGTTPVPGDYNGDGKCDLAVYSPSTYTWYILSVEGELICQAQWGFSGVIPVPGDYDGDGKCDLAVYSPSTYTWYILSVEEVLLFQGQWGFSGVIPAPADYDGDGKCDICVYDPSTGNWYIMWMDGSGSTTVNWGWDDSSLVPIGGQY